MTRLYKCVLLLIFLLLFLLFILLFRNNHDQLKVAYTKLYQDHEALKTELEKKEVGSSCFRTVDLKRNF